MSIELHMDAPIQMGSSRYLKPHRVLRCTIWRGACKADARLTFQIDVGVGQRHDGIHMAVLVLHAATCICCLPISRRMDMLELHACMKRNRKHTHLQQDRLDLCAIIGVALQRCATVRACCGSNIRPSAASIPAVKVSSWRTCDDTMPSAASLSVKLTAGIYASSDAAVCAAAALWTDAGVLAATIRHQRTLSHSEDGLCLLCCLQSCRVRRSWPICRGTSAETFLNRHHALAIARAPHMCVCSREPWQLPWKVYDRDTRSRLGIHALHTFGLRRGQNRVGVRC